MDTSRCLDVPCCWLLQVMHICLVHALRLLDLRVPLGRRLKAMMGRKEADILQLISRVVSLQRDMLRPRAVPIIRHTSSHCAWPMDVL
jgi:hypothetical protein